METNGIRKKALVLMALLVSAVLILFCGMGRKQIRGATGIKGTVTASSLNVRTGPGTEYELLQVNNKNVYLCCGDFVEILSEQNNFYLVKFSYNEEMVEGYACKTYISLFINNATNEPETTPFVEETKEPEVTPKMTKAPETTKKPKVTETPEATKRPKVTETPETTKRPKVTETPEATKRPKVTATPEATKKPRVTATPKVTKKPEVTIVPEPTSTPKATAVAEPTNTPEVIILDPNEIPNALISTGEQTVTGLKINAKVTASALRVRKKPSTDAKQLVYNKKNVSLKQNKKITILKQKVVNGVVWYYVQFKYNKQTLKGYVHSDYTQLTFDKTVKGTIYTTGSVIVRKSPGVSKDYLYHKGKQVFLENGKDVVVKKEAKANSKKWFKVSFQLGKKQKQGFILANQVLFKGNKVTTGPAVTATPLPVVTGPSVTGTPEPTKKPSVNLTPAPEKTPTVTGTPAPIQSPLATSTPSATYTPASTKETETTPKPSAPADEKAVEGVVAVGPLNVRVEPGLDKEPLQYENKGVKLPEGTIVCILGTTTIGEEENWYYVSFSYDGKTLYGFVMAQYVQVEEQKLLQITRIKNEQEFEIYMQEQEFPESYKTKLRLLHKKHPLWSFVSYKTGLKWSTVVEKESLLSLNLISNTKGTAWKSFEEGAYDWSTDTFIAFDGKEWVTPSKAALCYYMDPRNFLTEENIYQFEKLSYEKEQQTLAGIELVLKDTPLHEKTFTYADDTGKKVQKTYAQAFLEAAQISDINPYHLAVRVKQEVVTSKTTLSASASGTVSGYEGIYNFYNIGAHSSTSAGGSVINALEYALKGKNVSDNNTYLIPWNNPYKAIVGGAIYIANGYISQGQDTVYLQKFNVTPVNTYNHQYMTNVSAPVSEAAKSKKAYDEIGQMAMVFSVPVYEEMPADACPQPNDGKNPNNWLKALEVEGYSFEAEFSVTDKVGTEYVIEVPEKVSIVNIIAKTVSNKAKITGDGEKEIVKGTNTFSVEVTAENGDVRTYTIHVKK